MKSRLRIGLFLIIISLILSTGTVASADSDDYGKGRMISKQKQHFDKMFDELNLSPEQKKKLDENKERQKQEIDVLRIQIKAKHKLLREAIAKPEMSIGEIKSIHNDLKTLIARMEDLRLEGILRVRQILTKEQFMLFQEKAQRMNKMMMPANP